MGGDLLPPWPALAPPRLSTSLSPKHFPLPLRIQLEPSARWPFGDTPPGSTPASEVGPNCPPKEERSLKRQQNMLPEGVQTPRGRDPRITLPPGWDRGLHPRRGQGQALAAVWGCGEGGLGEGGQGMPVARAGQLYLRRNGL